MDKEYLKEFLAYQGKKELAKENKVALALYTAFTVLFLDVHFLFTVDLNIENTIWFIISALFTALAVPFLLLCIKFEKNTVFRGYLLQTAIYFFTSLVFFICL